MTEGNLTHRVDFEGGHDCIRFECISDSPSCKPGGGGSHGVHGLQIRWLTIGPKGAVQFLLGTRWLPQFVEPNAIRHREFRVDGLRPLAMDLGYHSLTPRYEGEVQNGPCDYLGGAACFYDGSGLNADDAFYALVNGGGTGLWAFLDAYYAHVYEGAPYPAPCEYPKPLRGECHE